MYECYECGVDRGDSGMREDGNCIDCGPVTKKKLKHRVEELIEAHDRLAAENAELRELLEIEQATAHDAAELSAAWANAASEANATLDALREAVPDGALCYCYECEAFVVGDDIRRSYNKRCPKCGAERLVAFAHELQSILYPQPKETTDDE